MKASINFKSSRFVSIALIFFIVFILSCNIFVSQDHNANPSNLSIQGQDAGVQSQGTRQSSTHTVFAEYFTTEWCTFCPSASAALKSVYTSKDFDFYYVSMILEDDERNTISEDAKERANEFAVDAYPTVEFEGGYIEVVGGQDDDSTYRTAVEDCSNRPAADIDLEITAEYMGNAEIDLEVKIINNQAEPYSGRLRVYIVEIVSRYLNFDGDHSSYGFLDFAIEKDVTVDSGGSEIESAIWDGTQITDGLGNDFSDIDEDNIIIYATMSNSERATALDRHPQSSMVINLYFIDEAEAAYLTPGGHDDSVLPFVKIDSPAPNDAISGNYRIEATATDDNKISNVEYQIDFNAVWTRMFPTGPGEDEYFAFWETSIVEDGPHTITIRAIDMATNQNQDSVYISVANYANDKTKPSIEIEDLVENQKISGSLTFTVVVIDDSEIERVRFRLEGSSWSRMNPSGFNKYEGTLNTTEFSDGKSNLEIEAKDRAGNVKVETLSIEISNNPSSKKSNNPLPGFETFILISAIALVMVILFFNRSKK
jgi:glutaredoxin